MHSLAPPMQHVASGCTASQHSASNFFCVGSQQDVVIIGIQGAHTETLVDLTRMAARHRSVQEGNALYCSSIRQMHPRFFFHLQKLYALSKTDEIGSFCHASGDDVNHFLVIKVVNAKTGKNDCIILSTQDIVSESSATPICNFISIRLVVTLSVGHNPAHLSNPQGGSRECPGQNKVKSSTSHESKARTQ